LTWKEDADLISARILSVDDWEAIRWLLQMLPKPALKDWLQRRRGAGLSDRQLRFWEVILELPRRQVNAWLAGPARQVWERRCQRPDQAKRAGDRAGRQTRSGRRRTQTVRCRKGGRHD
jgi:hypothetical protein